MFSRTDPWTMGPRAPSFARYLWERWTRHNTDSLSKGGSATPEQRIVSDEGVCSPGQILGNGNGKNCIRGQRPVKRGTVLRNCSPFHCHCNCHCRATTPLGYWGEGRCIAKKPFRGGRKLDFFFCSPKNIFGEPVSKKKHFIT